MNWLPLLAPQQRRLCLTLLHSLWQVALLAVIVWLVDRWWRKNSVERTYWLHVAALLHRAWRCCRSRWRWSKPRQIRVWRGRRPAAAPASNDAAVLIAAADHTPGARAKEASASLPAQAAADSPNAAPPNAAEPMRLPALWLRFAPWLVGLYAGGVAVLARLLSGIFRAERLRRLAQPITAGPLVESLQNLRRRWSMQSPPRSPWQTHRGTQAGRPAAAHHPDSRLGPLRPLAA